MDKLLCARCGHIGKPTTRTPGSTGIELVLWLALLVPGLIYSLWRLNARHDVCEKCSSVDLLPADSPRAVHLMVELGMPIATSMSTQPPSPPSKVAYGAGRALGALFKRRR